MIAGKQARQDAEIRKSERAAGPAQGEKKEQKLRTSSEVTSQSIVQKQFNENGAEAQGDKQKILQQMEAADSAGIVDPNNIFLQTRTASQMETQEQRR